MVVIIGLIIILGCAAFLGHTMPHVHKDGKDEIIGNWLGMMEENPAYSDAPDGLWMLFHSFWVPTEYITIAGLGIGAMVIMAPSSSFDKSFQGIICHTQRYSLLKKSMQTCSWPCMNFSCLGEKMA